MSETIPVRILGGEVVQLKPAGGRSVAEAQAFLEERRKEAERIDPQTCEIAWWYADWVDIYGIFERTEHAYFSKECFVRNGPDGIWVCGNDLPERGALIERIEREAEAEAYALYLKRPKESRERWRAKHELWKALNNYNFCLAVKGYLTEEAHNLRAYLREWEERHPGLLESLTVNLEGVDNALDVETTVAFNLVRLMLDKNAALPNESNR